MRASTQTVVDDFHGKDVDVHLGWYKSFEVHGDAQMELLGSGIPLKQQKGAFGKASRMKGRPLG